VRGKVVAVGLAIAVVVIVLASVLTPAYPHSRDGSRPVTHALLNITASVEVKVLRNGEVIGHYEKVGDPITKQFYYMLVDNLFGWVRTSSPKYWYDTGGNTRTWIDTEEEGQNPIAYIAIGQGSGTPSRNDYALFSEVMKDKAEVTLTDDTANNKYVITYTKTFTSQSSFNLTEVGLMLYVDYSASQCVYKTYVLIAHDVLQSPLNVSVGDSISVTYTIEVPYDTGGPFTKTFYAIFINYFLGYKGTSGSSLTIVYESGSSTIFDGRDNDNPSDAQKVRIEVGSGSSSSTPLWTTYALGSKVADIRQDNAQFLVQYSENSTHITLKYIASLTFTSDTSVSEVGFSIEDDNRRKFLLLYFPLDSSISVPANGGLRVEIVVEIPFA